MYKRQEHVPSINYLTTLAGFVHWQITGQKVLGIGDASGMLPIDPITKNYSSEMVDKFDKLIAPKGYDWKLRDKMCIRDSDGDTIQLPQNNFGHCLHGGPKGWQYQVYSANPIDSTTLELTRKMCIRDRE